MKKTLLFLAAVAFSFSSAIAQDLIIDREADGTSLQASGDPVSNVDEHFAMADYFELDATTEIDRFIFPGLSTSNTLDADVTGVNLFIFVNDDGVPMGTPTIDGGALIEHINVDPSKIIMLPEQQFDNGNWQYTILIEADALDDDGITLVEGEYWLSMSFDVADGDDMFYWASNASASVAHGTVASMGDSGWLPAANFYTNLPAVNAMAWQMYGEQTLGVEDFTTADLTLYPNPASDQFNISSGNELIQTVIVRDILGKTIETIQVNGLNQNVNISNLPKGLYLVEVELETGRAVQKLIKN